MKFTPFVVLAIVAMLASTTVADVIPGNSILVACGGNPVVVLDLNGNSIGTITPQGTGYNIYDTQQATPGGEIVMADSALNAFRRYDGSGTYLSDYSTPGITSPNFHRALTTAGGKFYGIIGGSSTVPYAVRLNPATGTTDATLALSGSPRGIIAGTDGNMYASNYTDGIHKFPADLSSDTLLSSWTNGQCMDIAYGSDGNLYVASYVSRSVERYNGTTGVWIDSFVSWASGSLGNATGVLFHPTSGNLLVGDLTNNVIREYQGPNGASPGAYVGIFASVTTPWFMSVTAVPEPCTLGVLLMGAVSLAMRKYHRRR